MQKSSAKRRSGVSTSELAERFGVTSRAVRYVVESRCRAPNGCGHSDVAAVSCETDGSEELEALDEVLALPPGSRAVHRGAAAAHTGGGWEPSFRTSQTGSERWRATGPLCMRSAMASFRSPSR